MMPHIATGLLLCFLCAPQVLAGDDSSVKGSELPGFMAASAAVDAFFQAMRAEDLDALMETVDVPWFHDGKKIVESKDELQTQFGGLLQAKDFSTIKATVKQVQAFGPLRDQASGQSGELLKKMAHDSDLFFHLEIALGEKSDGMILLVRVDDGKAKVIGLRD
ncbi:MAG: hypothetical protein RIC55_18400 [Pirellulaceae bacterium]